MFEQDRFMKQWLIQEVAKGLEGWRGRRVGAMGRRHGRQVVLAGTVVHLSGDHDGNQRYASDDPSEVWVMWDGPNRIGQWISISELEIL